jgi:hypothetical protein
MKPDFIVKIAMLKKRSLLVLLVPCTHLLHIKQEAGKISTLLRAFPNPGKTLQNPLVLGKVR